MGTIINVAAIIVGGIIGLLCGSRLEEKYQNTAVTCCGLCTLFIGITGALSGMFSVADGKLETAGTMMTIICFVLGGFVGEFFDIDGNLERFGNWLKKKTGSEGDGGFVNAFVTVSLTVSIGAMAIVGSIQDGIYGDYSTLAAKSVLDFVILIVFAASMGKGAIFSAIPVGLLQGGVTLLSRFIEPIMTPAALSNISITGSILIFGVGINLLWPKKIKVANLLPTLIFAVIWAFLPI